LYRFERSIQTFANVLLEIELLISRSITARLNCSSRMFFTVTCPGRMPGFNRKYDVKTGM
jgi:hypothetical protein